MVQSDESTDRRLAATPDEAAHAVQGGLAYMADLERRLAPYFERAELWRRALAYLRGLLSPAERKNTWQLAEISGETTPYAFQHLLRRALWDANAVRDALRRYIFRPMCWRSRARSMSGWTGNNAESTPSWRPCRARGGPA